MSDLILGVETEILARPRPTGVERALRLWLAGLATAPGVRLLAFARTGDIPLPAGVEPVHLPSPLPLALWREVSLPRALAARGVEVLLSPVTAIPLRRRVPAIATIHELPWLERGTGRPPRREVWRSRLALQRADTILTVSAAAARQVVELARRRNLTPPPIRVVRHGFGPPAPPPHLLPPRERPPLVVTVAADRPRKNLAAHLAGFAAVADRIPDAGYVIVGPRGRGRERLAAQAARLGLAGRIHLPGYLPDREVEELLERAAVLLHAPLSEGFGFTPLEAMARGCLPLISRRGALPEISGKASLILDDPPDPTAIAAGLDRALVDGKLRASTLEQAPNLLARRDPQRARDRLLAVCAETAWRGGRS